MRGVLRSEWFLVRDDLIIAKEIVDKKGKAEFRYLREDVWKDKDCKAVEVVRRGGDFRRVPAAARFIANNVRGLRDIENGGVEGIEAMIKRVEEAPVGYCGGVPMGYVHLDYKLESAEFSATFRRLVICAHSRRATVR